MNGDNFPVGLYHHPPGPELVIAGFHAHEVSNSWTNQFGAFVSSYAAKGALWLRRL